MTDKLAQIIGARMEGDGEKHLFEVNISEVFGKDLAPIANDFMRMLCIQLAMQVLVASSSSAKVFTTEFFMLLLYVAIGVMLYWAVIRKLVVFK